MVLIEWSKNNQNYKKELWVPVKPSKNKSICLVRCLDHYFKTVKVADHQPCFSFHNERNEVKALTYGQLNEHIKTLVKRTGRDRDQYSTHCLRRGGTNFAVCSGISPEYIQVMGDWASQSFLMYIDFALDLRLNLAEKIANNPGMQG